MIFKNQLWLFIFLFVFSDCKKDESNVSSFDGALFEIPKGFPEVDFPTDNQYTIERWGLGKRLFFDPILSKDSTKSCASCHLPDLAFSDEVAFSIGVDDQMGTRNAPSLANVAYHPYYTREGGVPTLEMQVLVPIQEHNEFDFNIVVIAELLNKENTYVTDAQNAYQRNPDPFVISRALSTFERSLLSGYSAYDQEIHYEMRSLSDSEKKGMNLFFSDKTNCSSCHSGFNFSNYAFENNGLYTQYADIGRKRLTNKDEDLALFKVPSLRNIELTAPYMHDGSINSLSEVISHYNAGGLNHHQKSHLIRPLGLSETEGKDLEHFLKSLTDHQFINNTLFQK